MYSHFNFLSVMFFGLFTLNRCAPIVHSGCDRCQSLESTIILPSTEMPRKWSTEVPPSEVQYSESTIQFSFPEMPILWSTEVPLTSNNKGHELTFCEQIYLFGGPLLSLPVLYYIYTRLRKKYCSQSKSNNSPSPDSNSATSENPTNGLNGGNHSADTAQSISSNSKKDAKSSFINLIRDLNLKKNNSDHSITSITKELCNLSASNSASDFESSVRKVLSEPDANFSEGIGESFRVFYQSLMQKTYQNLTEESTEKK